jgi:hypothetical protein
MLSSRDPQQGDRPGLGSLLRPEARPLAYQQLDQQQQQAFRRLVALLEGATSRDRAASPRPRAGGVGRPSPNIFLDHARSSRTILVSGRRGTGKTTLLLSLADALTSGSELPHSDLEPMVPQLPTNQLESLRRRLVWLETLDMEPLSNTANLLGAVLARIEDAMGTLLPPPEDDERPRTSLLFPGPHYHEVQREMVRLQTSVALSFDGNLAERAGNLDPDTFAIESRRTERERLGLNRRFTQVLADLSTVLSDTSVSSGQIEATVVSPVFVLPVDDLDLSPSTSVPLLELLRAVNSPHLLVIVAADHELLSTILGLKYQGELARIAAPADVSEEILRKGRDLAVNALRKHIPPSQRILLGLVDPDQALGFAPPGYPEPLRQRLGTAELAPDVLDLVLDSNFTDASSHEAGVSAPDSVTHRASLPATGLSAQILRGYSWPEILRVPLRTLLDLYLESGPDRAAPNPQEPAWQQVARSRLSELLEAVSPSVEGPAPDPVIRARMTQRAAIARGPTEIRTQTFGGWDVYFSSLFSRDEAGAFAGALDLLHERAGLKYSAPLVQSPRETTLRTSLHDEWTVPWPWVRHTTFWGYERAFRWLKEVEALWGSDPDRLFGSWVAVMTAQLFDSPDGDAVLDAPRLADPRAPWSASWPELGTRLEQLPRRPAPAGRASAFVPRAEHWLLAVGLLCTPEMGLQEPESVANLVPSQMRRRVAELRQSRRRALPPALQGLAGESLAGLPATPPPRRRSTTAKPPRSTRK